MLFPNVEETIGKITKPFLDSTKKLTELLEKTNSLLEEQNKILRKIDENTKTF